MTITPAVLALLLGSALTGLAMLWGAGFAVRLLARWDLNSGSETQLVLERRTYLASALISAVLVLELLSLFLFVHTAESMHTLFVGAMCAAGTFAVNSWGYPALVMKIAVFLGAGAWLVVNHADSLGHDYPLTRYKYALLLVLAPLALASSALMWLYLLNLRADVITSCCGTLFSVGSAAPSETVLGMGGGMGY